MKDIKPSTDFDSEADSEEPVLHVVSHTHWDREWYLSFENFRLLLVDLVDHLLEILEGDPEFRFFHLDGQTVVLEDYLELRPHNRARLESLIRAGRILIGPWYLQNDEFLTSGEATIRNLLIGRRICAEFGAPAMAVGYIPDQFGNISQMPQILRGFGIGSAVFGRGSQGPVDESGKPLPEFLWEGGDGSEVFAIHLMDWYNNAQRFPADTQRAVAMCQEIIERQRGRARTRHLLLMNGVDHLEVQENLSGILGTLNASANEFRVVHDTLPHYIQCVRGGLSDVPRYRGEFREGDEGNVLSGTASSRVYLKQLNFRCQQELQVWAEPFAVWARVLGCEYDFQSAIDYAWKMLIQCHPHDSICGCSIDEVHFQMTSRFRRVLDVLNDQLARALGFIAGSVKVESGVFHSQIVIFNPLPISRSEVVRAQVDTLAAEDLRRMTILDGEGNAVAFEVLSTRLIMKRVINPKRLPKLLRVRRSEVVLGPVGLPPCGYAALVMSGSKGRRKNRLQMDESSYAGAALIGAQTGQGIDAKAKEAGTERRVSRRVAAPLQRKRRVARLAGVQIAESGALLRNEYLSVSFNADGTINLAERNSDRSFHGMHFFEDTGDSGNEYIYRQPKNDSERTTRGVSAVLEVIEDSSLIQIVRVSYPWRIPANVDDRKQSRVKREVNCTIESTFVLRGGSKMLEVETRIINAAKDHRLRVMFPTHLLAHTSFADAPFDIVERPFDLGVPNRNNQHPMQSFFTVSGNDGKGLAILSAGMPEFEVRKPNAEMCLTLLRCVDLLGDLPSEEWKRDQLVDDYCPDAQCHGEHVFRYGIFPFKGSIDEANVALEASKFHAAPRLVQLPENRQAWEGVRYGAPEFFDYFEDSTSEIPRPPQVLQQRFSFFEVSNPAIVLSACKFVEKRGACEGVENSNALVVRFANLSSKDQHGWVELGVPVRSVGRCNLAEEPEGEVHFNENRFEVDLAPRKLQTFIISVESPKSALTDV